MVTRNTIILIGLSLFICCKQQYPKYPNISRIVDDSLISVIKKYVQDTNLDTNSRFVSIECMNSRGKIIYEISAGKSNRSYSLSPPDNFALVDDVLVIFRMTDGKIIEFKDITGEIDLLVAEKGIVLEKEIMNYDPPLWTLIRCENKYKLLTKSNDTTLEYLPCKYYLTEDWSSDSVTLHERR